jgi:hypothetical protein
MITPRPSRSSSATSASIEVAASCAGGEAASTTASCDTRRGAKSARSAATPTSPKGRSGRSVRGSAARPRHGPSASAPRRSIATAIGVAAVGRAEDAVDHERLSLDPSAASSRRVRSASRSDRDRRDTSTSAVVAAVDACRARS